jgi:hypothetical protein
MSRLQIPIAGQILWHTGDVRLWVHVKVNVKDRYGNWHRRRFQIDTATDVTTMGAYDAGQLALPMPVGATAGAVHRQTGLAIRSGYLRFQIIGMDQTEYVTSCLFLGDPNTPPAGPFATLPRKLLQPLALLNQLRFEMKHDPGDGTPYGVFVVEKK